MPEKKALTRSAICGAALSAAAWLTLTVQPSYATTIVFQTNFDTLNVPFGDNLQVPSIEGWTQGPTSPNLIEVQNHCCGTPQSEPNNVELDTNGLGNSSMSRTIAGAGNYLLQWFYSPRPGVPADSNGIQVLLDGVPIQTIAEDGTGNLDTVWSLQLVPFKVGASPATLEFLALGVAEGLGGYIDTVTLFQVPEPGSLSLFLTALVAGGFGLMWRARACGLRM